MERTQSWMNRFRRLLVRWEKNVENYPAMLHFACAWITFRAAELYGQAPIDSPLPRSPLAEPSPLWAARLLGMRE